ncbi:MAG: peptidoglycan bridge formation glycyltransferase FemA/FemB family protein [Candidatus Daviesbacteria bacterium]
MDIRRSKEWGDYLTSINWQIEKFGKNQAFIRKLPLLPYSVIKIQHPINPLLFKKIDQIARKHKALFVLVEPEEKGFNQNLFLKQGYQKSRMSLTHTSTIYIDLTLSKEKLFSSFSENARRNIKKAQSNNLTVKKVFLKDEKDDTQFKKFYELLHNLTKLKKFYVPGYGEFYKKMLVLKNSSILLFAYQDNNPIAIVWTAFMNKYMFYLHTGVTQKGYNLLANYLLVWEALKLAQKLKLKVFDFEGIYDPRFPKQRQSWKGLSQFKKRFHGKLIEYPQPQIKFYNKVFKLFYLCGNLFSR